MGKKAGILEENARPHRRNADARTADGAWRTGCREDIRLPADAGKREVDSLRLVGIRNDISGLAFVGALERVDGFGRAAGISRIMDFGDGAAAEDFVLSAKFEDFFDVAVDRIRLIKRLEVGIAEFWNFCEDRTRSIPHIFAVAGVISAHESLLGAIINARNTTLEKEEGEGIFE